MSGRSRYSKNVSITGDGLDCSQSSIFRKIIEIERFALRAAILRECQNYLRGGCGLGEL